MGNSCSTGYHRYSPLGAVFSHKRSFLKEAGFPQFAEFKHINQKLKKKGKCLVKRFEQLAGTVNLVNFDKAGVAHH